MGSQRNTGAFVAGSMIGGLVGAALALWKTPKSGAELRAGLPGSGHSDAATEHRFSNPVLGFVEKATAPLVGVELGKLAKDDPHGYDAPVRTSAADARPPVPGTTSSADQTTEALGVDNLTPAEQETYDPVQGSAAHVATTDDLTAPPADQA